MEKKKNEAVEKVETIAGDGAKKATTKKVSVKKSNGKKESKPTGKKSVKKSTVKQKNKKDNQKIKEQKEQEIAELTKQIEELNKVIEEFAINNKDNQKYCMFLKQYYHQSRFQHLNSLTLHQYQYKVYYMNHQYQWCRFLLIF